MCEIYDKTTIKQILKMKGDLLMSDIIDENLKLRALLAKASKWGIKSDGYDSKISKEIYEWVKENIKEPNA